MIFKVEKINLIVLILIITTVWTFNHAYGGSGYLDIVSDPSGVKIFINGKLMGETPLSGLEVRSGQITINAKKEGFGSATKQITLKDDEVLSIKIPLKRTSGSKGREIVLSQDKGSLLLINQAGPISVYIDDDEKGKGSMKIDQISTGDHTLKVGNLEKVFRIYKDHKLKIKITKSDIVVLNDVENERRKAKIESEKRRKEEARRRIESEERRKQQELENKMRAAEEERKKQNTCIEINLFANWSSCRRGNTNPHTSASPPGWFGFYINFKHDALRRTSIYRKLSQNEEKIKICNPPIFSNIEIKFVAHAEKTYTFFGKDYYIWENEKVVHVDLETYKTVVLDAKLANEKININMYNK
ncbi:PEGA domain-containing protein [Thermodesulfobacteriota bacterium]